MMETAHNAGRLSSGEKRALLARLFRTKGREHRPFTLSFTQQRLWFMDQLEPGTSAYNIRLGFSLKGKLDVAALEQSINEIVRRHESLRTSFSAVNGQPVQIIVPGRTISIQQVDISNLPASRRLAVAEALAFQEGQRSFDLQRDLLCRARLVRLESDLQHFLLTMHHIISDGWSMELFYRELTTLYEAFSSGQSSELTELTLQYVDYAQWQRDWLQGEVLDEHLGYWKRRLAGAPALLELTTDRPRTATQTYRGRRESLVLSKQLTDGLRAFSLSEGATLFMTLLAAFKALLYRYSGQTDVVVGTPVANRNRTEVESIVGPLVNTLVLRSNLSGQPSYRKLLRRVTHIALSAYSHQELPFDVLLDNLDVKRDLSYNPVFQVMFSLHRPPADTLKLAGVVASRLRINTDTTKFDLNLAITEGEQGLRAAFEYNTDLFDQATIRRMLGHFEMLLTGILADPDQSISELPLVGEEETRKLLFDWNNTARDFGEPDRVHRMFEEQVACTPDRVAVVYDEDQVSFEQLNRQSNQLANYLIAQAVRPEDKVAICLERSIDMVTAVLAIQKAGASYLPLDPSYPTNRLAFMLDDAQAPVLVTQADLLKSLPKHHAKVICIDAEREAIAEHCAEDLAARGTGENLAYVLYTSGSTGVPKGVQIEHRAVTNFLNSMRELVGITEQDRMLAVTTLSFDIAGLELFLPLSVGARLEVASRDEAGDGDRLSRRLTEIGTTVMQATPATWRMLLQTGWQGEKQVRILCGGEALGEELAGQLEEAGRCVWNLYGPTETTIWSAADELHDGTVTIGQPIANTQIYILDEHLELAPTGVIGDIFIAGKGVGRGYLNLAEQTADRFVPDFGCIEPGARMYKTGDRGRYRADGKIKYEGRVDHQIKLRGYRIELSEIEAVLNRCSAVRQSVVTIRGGDDRDKRLVAYIVSNGDVEPRITDIKDYLKKRLPDYMVPSQFLVIESFPLTPNGKVDRAALAALEPIDRNREDRYVEARNAVEEIVAGIWSQLLRVERVGVEEDFFELGGHSLLATQVISRIRQAFQIEIPLRALFEAPTVAGLASLVEAERMRSEGACLPAVITPVSRDQNLPTSFSQSREWLLQQLEPETYAYNIPTAISLRGKLMVDALQQSINEIIRRHESLRTNFIEFDGQPVQSIKQQMILRIPLVELKGLSEFACKVATRQLVKLEAEKPFNLAEDTLARASVVSVADDHHILLLTMHHIVSDGWSRGIFERELETHYRAYVDGERSPLSEPSIQYADFAWWQRQWLEGEVLDGQLAYWKRQLSEPPSILELPADRPRPPAMSYRGATEIFWISKELSLKLRELSRKHAVTLYMTLLAAFQVLLSRYANQTDIPVGTYIANRNRREIEGLIGFFVNTLVMRSDLSGNPTFRELLGRVRRVTVDAFAHQDVPFEKLLGYLQVERARSHTPLFQVMLVHQTAAQRRLQLPALDISPLTVERARANFDLTLVINERGDELQGKLEYNVDLFNPDTAARLMRHFINVLETVVAEPDQRILNLPLLTAVERSQSLVESHGAKQSFSSDRCIHELFEDRAESTPDAIALVYETEQLTFRELNRRANQLAHYLNKKSVGPDVVVGICLERSVDTLVSILGVLKAGGAYAALDPAYPIERIAFMAKDSQTPVVITVREFANLVTDPGVKRVLLDADRRTIALESDEDPARFATADNLAYVIYTSGSTGKPKGVMVQHRSLINYTEAAIADFNVSARDRVLQFASINFDTSAEEIYPCLAQGATLVLRTESMLGTASSFLDECREQSLSVLDLPTAYWHELTDEIVTDGLDVPECVRLVIIGGEKAAANRMAQWQTHVGDAIRLVNTYGPTEATIVTTRWEAQHEDPVPADAPIGRPIDNAEAYVLDQFSQPVPTLVHGELHIGGTPLARGYLNQPGLTAEKFIPNPFTGEPGVRLYKTGDLVRYVADRNLEYVGRIDHQVKVRGYRIELEEIEAALLQHTGIREAAAMVVENGSGDKRLTAFVVLDEDTAVSVSELRNKLKRKMPEYMLPSVFIKLDGLPKTVSGKLDRRALSILDGGKLEVSEAYVAPRTAVEELLAGIWADLLEADEVGVEENFFDLGGHSLLAAQVVARVRQAFQVEVPLRALFDSPTVAGLAEAVESALSSTEPQSVSPITAVARNERLRLSSAQERLWFLDKLNPGSSAYNIPAAMRLKGRLDLPALEQSLREIMRRHEVLRTRFEMNEGDPVQVIDETPEVQLAIVDSEQLPEYERQREMTKLTSLEAGRQFDLDRGPVLRARLLKITRGEHLLLLTLHHVAGDGWSTGVLVRELVQLYEAFTKGERSPLEELQVQYADYAQWEREMLDSAAVEQKLSYWREKLGDLPVLELPTDRTRPAVQSDRGASQSFFIPQTTSEGLKKLSRREGVTLFMTLLAAFKVMLSRYSGQKDIVVGTPIAGRNYAETRDLIGFFINTLVLRTDLSGDPQFSQLLVREREVALQAYLNQEVPFEKLVEELQPDRNLGRSPLFQVMFALQNIPKEGVKLAGLKMTPARTETKTAHFELSLAMSETRQGLKGTIAYSTDLYEAGTVRRMLEHYKNLLEGVVSDAEMRISELPMLSEEEKRQLEKWNETGREYGEERCIQQLFEEQAAGLADRVAVVFGTEQITYSELNRRSNQLGRYLRKMGVGPEVVAGVCIQRSVEMIVGILGVLKAGGAYLPLDPAYPPQRLRYMLEDVRAKVLLGETGTIAAIEEGIEEEFPAVVDIQSRRADIALESAENCESEVTAKNLAYVIYTSGSTGVPKGIGVSHEGLLNLVHWHQQSFAVRSDDQATQLAGLSFDASVWELWPYLGAGASIHIVDDETRATPVKLLELLVTKQITKTFLPTPLAEIVLTMEWPEQVALRIMLTGGDKLHRHPAGYLPFEVVNNYGPSESSVVSTSGRIETNQLSEKAPVIGTPIANTRIHIANGTELVHIGAAGELCVAGTGLARGYLNHPELTAERFVPNAYSAEAGARMYRTGDLGRYHANGDIDYLGRIDDQVKIRGYRIEPGEIENALMTNAAIKEAVVLAQGEEAGTKRLVGYVVCKQDSEARIGELKDHLRQKLPEYMVPGHFVVLSSLPLTPNGKVDKRALSAMRLVDVESGAEYAMPRNLVEEILAGICSQVLKVERVGRDQNFFDLGGHSLLATQVVSRIRQAFQIDIPLRSLFESPTVADLAQVVEQTMAAISEGRAGVAVSIKPASRRRRVRLSSAQERLWFLHKLRPESSAYNIPWVMRLKGPLDVESLEQSLAEIVRRHEVLRTTFELDHGQPVQIIRDNVVLKLTIVDLTRSREGDRETEARRLAALAAAEPFDLSRGPVIRARLLKLASADHILLLVIHHIAGDGWSKGVLVRELVQLCRAFSAGEPCPLKELDIQYADYAEWQRQMLEGESLKKQLDYWKEKLGGDLPVLELPADHARPAVQSERGASRLVVISKDRTDGLRNLSRSEGATLFMTLLAAFKVLLSRYTGQKDIVIGTPIAGRTYAETEGLIGFFVNTLVLRTDLTGDPSFREVLAREREVALEAYLNQDAPFEKLVEELLPDRDLSHAPLFQAMFAFQNVATETLALPGLETGSVRIKSRNAQFDLGLTLSESNGELKGSVEYNTDLFEPPGISRMIANYQVLLEGIVSNPDLKLSELPVLSEAEQRQLLIDWNDTATESGKGKCIHHLIEEQAERAADRIAMVCEDEQVSYAELNRKANQLAHYLRRSGVGPDTRVGICMERSIEMIVGLLGILKAGGAYVPIDPGYPKQRVGLIVKDAELTTILTQQRWIKRLSTQGASAVAIDRDWGELELESTRNPEVKPDDDNLVYTIYTSGSTGVPKGAEIRHRGLINYISYAARQLEMREADNILQFASLSFDTAAEEIFTTLTSGARLILRSDQMLNSVARFLETCEKCGVSGLLLATAYWHEVIGEIVAKQLTVPHRLRFVYVGGEQILTGKVRDWWARAVGVKLFNGYGPTELTIVASMEELNSESGKDITIGRGVGNTKSYILDDRLDLAPVGVGGELYIGGDGLARGYLKRPDLTAASFVPDPFSGDGARLYRTGDRARHKGDGRLEYLGRNDAQVKIRGYRVELGEIEAALREVPDVDEAVVVMRVESATEKQLVAYVVGRRDEVSSEKLRGHLRERLPAYMIPSAFVPLASLPLLPNGKVDRGALLALERPLAESKAAYVGPRTGLEQVITNIWSRVLTLEKLGMNDNFFDLGGTSLTLIQVSSELKDALNREIPLIELFEYPTINELAAHLSQENGLHLSLKQAQDRGAKQKEAMKRQRRMSAER